MAGARLAIIPNGSPANQPALLVEPQHAVAVARFLRDDAALRFDYASNVSGADWLEKVLMEKVSVKRIVGGVEKEFAEIHERIQPGYLEVVYHLYSMELKHGPLVIRQRTKNRSDQLQVASLTPVWRSCEFQEREVYDLFGIFFTGHPDLRRLLMWDEFKDHPLRKDYQPPEDYEYESAPPAAGAEQDKHPNPGRAKEVQP